MRDIRFLLKPRYANSRALIIGIDQYINVPKLGYAVNDAVEIKETLISELGFPKENVRCLLNDEATKTNILRAFNGFCVDEVELDDRIFIFFAGHGHTITGFRGEVGYLVPHDANIEDISSLIRWQELTGYAELIRAKHMFFIMDACYGGLALTRSLHPGSVRFLKDMTLRYSRQVLTAGKADEVVSDGGGPLPNHSVFTGHLIEGLRGGAATAEGVITASGLMAYVYNKVAHDRDSNQTPHYGYFDGDGDFVLAAPRLFAQTEEAGADIDEAFVVPFIEEITDREATPNKVARVKKLLSDDSSMIELHDVLVKEVQHFLSASSEDNFAVQGTYSKEELIERISNYERVTADLCALEACITYWAKPAHKQILQKVLARSTDRLDVQNGLSIWLNLRWYPLIIQVYAAGIAAVSGQRYDSLANIFFTKVVSSEYKNKEETLIEALSKEILELTRANVFKQLPDREKNHVPMSEHLFKLLQPALDDILFIGKDYENAFDEFEVLLALVAADLNKQADNGGWGPFGRFAYKYSSNGNGPYGRVVATANKEGKDWPPFKAGLFGGDVARFTAIAEEYGTMIARSGMYF